VRDHNEVCGAVMVFEELFLHKSPARRVLIFPSNWVEEPKESATDVGEKHKDTYALTRRRLLQKAARRFRVDLVPVRDMEDEAQAIAATFALDGYDRVLYLSNPGTVLNAAPLDSLLAFAPSAPLTALAAPDATLTEASSVSLSPSLLLIQPSKPNLDRIADIMASSSSAQTVANTTALLTTAFPPPASLLSSTFLDLTEQATLLTTTHTLTQASSTFNASVFLAETGYVHVSDPRLPGPEVSLPWNVKVKVRPQEETARKVWERVYEGWRSRRMEVCGLDLEGWREEFNEKLEETRVETVEQRTVEEGQERKELR